MKRKLLVLLLFLPLLSACGPKAPLMNELTNDNSYYYQNNDLGFALRLPAVFEYYQTQRVTGENYIDLEIFVPTSDEEYRNSIPPSYAKAVVVRIFSQAGWERSANTEKERYERVGDNGDQIYAVYVWEGDAEDWLEKWQPEIKEEIIQSFELK